MPVRFLNSSVHKWPTEERVLTATREWAEAVASEHPDILKVGVFGSYARGDAGVGSDLDVVIVVAEDSRPFEKRTIGDPTELPLCADVLTYTICEWRRLLSRESRFAETMRDEVRWLVRSSE